MAGLDPVSLGLNAVQTGMGLYQLLTNKEPDRVEYEIPDSMQSALDISKVKASSQSMPGEELLNENIQTGTASTINTLSESGDSKDVLGALSSQYDIELSKIQNLAINKANWMDRAEQEYQQTLKQMAEYQDKQWEWNVGKPYLQDENEYQTQKQAGLNNLMGGLVGAGSNLMAISDRDAVNKRYNDYLNAKYTP